MKNVKKIAAEILKHAILDTVQQEAILGFIKQDNGASYQEIANFLSPMINTVNSNSIYLCI